MPAASLADDVALIARILTGMHQQGLAAQLRQSGQVDLGQLAAAAGATPNAVREWEAGRALPPPHQALTWLAALHEAAGWRARAGETA